VQKSTIPADQGRATYGLFLELVRQADSALAQELHDIEGVKPFTVSNLQRTGRRVKGEVTLDPERPVWWRVTTFMPRLSQVVLEQVLLNLPDQVTLADQPFQVVGATADEADHAWAGQTSYEDLAQSHLLGADDPPPWLNLEFATPTTFRSAGKHLPFPLPGLVFDHWLNKWNKFAPLSLHPDVKRFAEECVAVSRYSLRSRVVRFGPATFIGFVGRCSFRALRRDPYWLRLLHTLAAYAFYCGTGHKTTMGLGQTRVQGIRD
jgi:CRISPR-associated endoribonuclease Cas6